MSRCALTLLSTREIGETRAKGLLLIAGPGLATFCFLLP
jgi:hypothetical protein